MQLDISWKLDSRKLHRISGIEESLITGLVSKTGQCWSSEEVVRSPWLDKWYKLEIGQESRMDK